MAFFGAGGRLEVAVVLKDGANATENDLKTWMKSLLPTQLPERINFVRELPRTKLGKIQRFKLTGVEAKL